MKSKLKISLILALAFSSVVHAQNREDQDTIFTEPAKASGTQVLLGIAELITAHGLQNGFLESPEVKFLKSAKSDLKKAEQLMTSEEQLQVKIQVISHQVNNGELPPEMGADQIATLKSRFVTVEQKAQAIATAKAEVNIGAKVALEAAQNKGILKKGVRGIKVVGSTVLVLDVLGRVYVWNELDANPTFSPGVTYVNHLIKK